MWCGSFASFMAMNMVWMTNGWLVLRLKDDSPLALAMAMLAFVAPMTIVSVFGGAMADRFPRRRNIMWSQSAAAIFAALLGVLDHLGIVTLWHVLVLGAAQGSALAINMPSRQALISEIVPESNLMNAISVNNAAMNLTRVIGPAMAGVLIIYVATSGVFYLVAGTYLFAAASMTMINAGKSPAKRSQKSMTGDIGEGFSYAAGNPVLMALIVMAFIPSMFGMSYHALLPAWAREALDVQSNGMGMLMMVVGIGALVGTLVLASLRDLKRRGLFLLVVCVAWGISHRSLFADDLLHRGDTYPPLLGARIVPVHVAQHDASAAVRGPGDAGPYDELHDDDLGGRAVERPTVRRPGREDRHARRATAQRLSAHRLHHTVRNRIPELPAESRKMEVQ